MRTIEWEAPALASLAAAHWLVAYERENSPRKRVRYENEIEFDGVAYMLMCEIELVEREHKAVSMMCGIYRYAGKNYWKYGKGHRRDFACAE